MKKRKILVLFPLLGLFLSGCTFQEALGNVKSWTAGHVLDPIKNLFNGGKKDEQKADEDEEPTPTPTPSEVTLKSVAFKDGPKSVEVNTQLDASKVKLTAIYSDASSKEVTAEKVIVDTSVVATGVKGVAEYKGKTAEFTIDVVEKTIPPVAEEKTPSEVIALCDAAGEGNVVQELIRVKGTVEFGSAKDNYGWSGKFEEKSEEKELIFGSAQTEEEYETLDGATVVLEGYAELYQGVYKVSYLPAKASPTGQAFNPTLVSVVPAAPKTVSAIVSVESAPAAVYVGDSIDKNDVVLNVTFSDGSSGKAHPDKVVVNTEVAAESVTATAYIGEFTITFNVKVAEKGKTVHEGTAEDPYTVSDAKVIFDGLESGKNTDGEVYVTGTIAAEPAPKINNKRGQFYISDGVCEKDLYIYNIDGINKAELKVEDIPAGSVVVAKGAIMNYSGTFELCYVKDVAGCELISIEKPAEKEITGLIANSATGIPESIEQGKSLNKNSITVGVNYSDGTTGTVHPDEIELDTSVPKDAVQGKLIVKTFEYLFTIKVTEKVAPQGEVTVKKTIAEVAEENNWVNSTQYLSFNLDDNITVTAAGKTNTGKFYTNGNEWRIYQSESPTVTISAGSLTIKKVTIEYNISNTGIMLVGDEQVASGSEVEVNASSFAFTVGNTKNDVTNGQVKVTSVEVVYQGSEPLPVVDVTSVEVAPKNLELDVSDDPAQLSATVLPEDATDKSVTWSSSNENVAKVSAEGLVTPVASGNATITAKAGDKTAECAVKVTTKVQSVEITETLNLVVGNEGSVYVSILPANADDLTYTLISSNPEVATVDEEGLVTAKAEGQATITVKTNDGEKTDTCLVTVSALEIPVESVELECEETIEMKIGDKLTLKAHGMPENATKDRAVEWALHDSEDEILAVYSDGRIEALKEGTVTVRATSVSNSEAHADVTVTVSKVAVESVELNKEALTLTVDESETLVATVSPDNATDKTVVWSSSNEEVATVDQDGLVTAIAQGEATITAEAGEFSATCVVTVEEAVAEKGTAENPYTVSEAYAEFLKLADGEATGEVYVEGYINSTTAPTISSGRGKLYLTDGVCATDLYLFNVNNVGGSNNLTLADLPVGGHVKASGVIKNYGGTFEVCWIQNSVDCKLAEAVTAPVITSVGAVTGPAEVTVGGTVNPSAVSVEVTYSGVVHSTVTAATATGNFNSEGPAQVNVTIDGWNGALSFDIEVVSSVQPTETDVYTLTPTNGSNNSYAGNCDIAINGVTWNLTGNSTVNPWRIGGKSLSGVNRELYSKTAISDNITKIEVTHGGASNITVNSWTLIVSKNADFSEPESSLELTFAANTKTTIERPEGADWSNCYFKFVYNVTVSGSSNKFVEFTGAVFYAVV